MRLTAVSAVILAIAAQDAVAQGAPPTHLGKGREARGVRQESLGQAHRVNQEESSHLKPGP